MSKLKINTTTGLLQAFSVKRIKEMLTRMGISEVTNVITAQNDKTDIIFGRFADKADYETLALIEEEVRKHVTHIKLHGKGLYETGIKELQPQDNLMQVLADARTGLSKDSAMHCHWEWEAYLRENMPTELDMIDKVYSTTLGIFDYIKQINHPVLSRITTKTRQPVLIQKGVIAAVEKAQALAPRLTKDFMEQSCAHYEQFFTVPYDQLARVNYSAANNLYNAVATCVITDEETLRTLAKLMHRFEIGIANELTHSAGESTLEQATASINLSRISAMQDTIKEEAVEAERLAQAKAEQEAKEAQERAEREAKFKDELTKEQRLLTLTAKVQDNSISFDEFEEFKQLKAA